MKVTEECECLNDCGDDPRVHKGEVKSCRQFKAQKRHEKREAFKEDIMKLIEKYIKK